MNDFRLKVAFIPCQLDDSNHELMQWLPKTQSAAFYRTENLSTSLIFYRLKDRGHLSVAPG